ncbi:hypothetical protein OEZ85_012853 [Tetradesmus obliquus]|uniref:Palmitoyl-protein thioesterase 1 n=1 Tax=Tetradesmus obliquus TaxID=3088 RepID=A0ABY8U451_TETOB|nr:hypothetical protein OEZ85_012853 [Tetradesmus obliquus]
MGRAWAVALLLVAGISFSCASRVPEEQLLLREATTGRTSSAAGLGQRGTIAAALPVVLWHGMGDSCCSMGSMGSIKQLIEDKLGVFVHSIATGVGEYQDVWSSFYGNVNQQVGKVCGELASMEELKGGFNMVGFSQGGQFLRAVVQRCGRRLPPIHSLITLGGQHQGVANTPGCSVDLTGAAAKACTAMQLLLARGAYAPWVRENIVQAQYFKVRAAAVIKQLCARHVKYVPGIQRNSRKHMVQAQYFKDPLQIDSYLRYNIFMPDINNERDDKNAAYADNLASLQRLVLFRFDEDTTVVPRDSAWFSFWDGAETVIPLKDQPLYKEDWLGLRRLDEAGGLIFESAPGEHMQFTLKWFEEKVVDAYLA